MSVHENTEKMGESLLRVAAEYGRHSGPASTEKERAAFGRDVHVAALRYARAYYAEARELGLLPEYEIPSRRLRAETHTRSK